MQKCALKCYFVSTSPLPLTGCFVSVSIMRTERFLEILYSKNLWKRIRVSRGKKDNFFSEFLVFLKIMTITSEL